MCPIDKELYRRSEHITIPVERFFVVVVLCCVAARRLILNENISSLSIEKIKKIKFIDIQRDR